MTNESTFFCRHQPRIVSAVRLSQKLTSIWQGGWPEGIVVYRAGLDLFSGPIRDRNMNSLYDIALFELNAPQLLHEHHRTWTVGPQELKAT